MKIAIVGSRNIIIDNLEKYLPRNITEIVSGGARGVDSCAKVYAESKGIPIKEFLPDYEKYGRSAPIKRNDLIIDYADMVIVFWDGESKGSKYVIERCIKKNKEVRIHSLTEI